MKKRTSFDQLELWVLRLCSVSLAAVILIIVGICLCVNSPEMLGGGLALIITGLVVAISVVIGVIRYSKASEERENELQDAEVLKGKLRYLELKAKKELEDDKKNEQKNSDTNDSNAHSRSEN